LKQIQLELPDDVCPQSIIPRR